MERLCEMLANLDGQAGSMYYVYRETVGTSAEPRDFEVRFGTRSLCRRYICTLPRKNITSEDSGIHPAELDFVACRENSLSRILSGTLRITNAHSSQISCTFPPQTSALSKTFPLQIAPEYCAACSSAACLDCLDSCWWQVSLLEKTLQETVSEG